MTSPAPCQCSVSKQIYQIRSFPNVKPEWDKLSTDQKRAVLGELDGDITERWTLQVIRDVREVIGKQSAVSRKNV